MVIALTQIRLRFGLTIVGGVRSLLLSLSSGGGRPSLSLSLSLSLVLLSLLLCLNPLLISRVRILKEHSYAEFKLPIISALLPTLRLECGIIGRSDKIIIVCILVLKLTIKRNPWRRSSSWSTGTLSSRPSPGKSASCSIRLGNSLAEHDNSSSRKSPAKCIGEPEWLWGRKRAMEENLVSFSFARDYFTTAMLPL